MTTKNQHPLSFENETVFSSKLGLESAIHYPLLDEVNLTTPEAAAYCRMAIPTFRLYLSRGEISGIKLGKAWLFTKSDLETFLNSYRIKSNAEIEEQANVILRRAKR